MIKINFFKNKGKTPRETVEKLTSFQKDALDKFKRMLPDQTDNRSVSEKEFVKHRIEMISSTVQKEDLGTQKSVHNSLNVFFLKMIAENPIGLIVYFIDVFLSFDETYSEFDLQKYIFQIDFLIDVICQFEKVYNKNIDDKEALMPLKLFSQKGKLLIRYTKTLIKMTDQERKNIFLQGRNIDKRTLLQSKYLNEKQIVKKSKLDVVSQYKTLKSKKLLEYANQIFDKNLVDWE